MDLIDELKETINLNKEEAIFLIKDYLVLYIISLIKDPTGSNNRKTLISKLKEYLKITKEENKYLNYIIDNLKNIKNIDELNNLLDNLDILNEETYKFYRSITESYEDYFIRESKSQRIVPYKEFNTLIETKEYKEKVIGLTKTREDLYNYYENEEALDYLKQNTKIIKGDVSENMIFYGCFPIIENNILKEIKICVPDIKDFKSMLINIHEYKHGIRLYSYLGKEFNINEKQEEVLAKKEEEKYKTKILSNF